jgi:transcriptional regulator with XRE-family HTH domain
MALPPPTTPTLRLRGEAVRRLRETKGLTQLYVAEVVGVTVDTVSRWENNRTSAVKRENALALAQALEVPIEEILPREGAPKEEGQPAPKADRQRRKKLKVWFCLLTLPLVGVGLWAGWKLLGGPRFAVRSERRLPAYTPPGTVVPVVVRIRVVSGRGPRVVLRERLPIGWTLVRSSIPPDAGPTTEGLVRWIVSTDKGETQVVYLVRSPAEGSIGTRSFFSGEVVTPGPRGKRVPVTGNSRIDLEWVHWADENGDFELSDSELLDALERIELLPGPDLDASILRDIWRAGGYSLDEKTRRFTAHPGSPDPTDHDRRAPVPE